MFINLRPTRLLTIAMISCAAVAPVLLVAVSALAQCDFDWQSAGSMPGTDGVFLDLTQWDPDGAGGEPAWLIVGGDFSTVADIVAHGIAAWDGTHWRALGTGVQGGSYPQVSALVDYNGELIAGGVFTVAGGVSANNIARWNGLSWQPLGSGTNNGVTTLAVYNGELIAAGSFTVAGGVNANRIARWNGTDWQPLSGGIDSGWVSALRTYNNELIAGGSFTSADGVSANHVARWNGTDWQPLGIGMNGFSPIVNAFSEYAGELIAGGTFLTAGGVSADGIARWDGSQWQPVGTGYSGLTSTLAVFNDELVAGGGIWTQGGASHVARWNGSEWQSLGTGTSGDEGEVVTLGVFDGELFASGPFYRAGNVGVRNAARWNGTEWLPIAPGLGNTGSEGDEIPVIYALTEYSGNIVAGGRFTHADGVAVNNIAQRIGTNWQPLGTGWIGGPAGPAVLALTVFNGDLIAGGVNTSAGGLPPNSIARWDGFAWHSMGSGINGATVYALSTYQGDLIAGGAFGIIARWDGLNWQVLPGLNNHVESLIEYDGKLIAGGRFTTAGGVSASRIASWNGTTWEALGTGFGGGSPVTVAALAVYHGDLIAGGRFSTAGGTSANYIARWDGSNWHPLGTGIAVDFPSSPFPPVLGLVVFGNDLMAGGWFTVAGGLGANHVARWNGAVWQPMSMGMSGNWARVSTFTKHDGQLFAGGAFTIAGDVASAYLARWGPTCPSADLNCDQAVTVDDVAPFVIALLDPPSIDNCLTIVADVNHDGALDGRDIGAFTSCLLAGGCG